MRKILYSFLISCFIFTIISCRKTDTGAADGGISLGSCDNSKAFIVGNAVTEKGCHPNCPEMKAVIWNHQKCMTVVGDSSYAVDAAEHNGSIYIADDGGF